MSMVAFARRNARPLLFGALHALDQHRPLLDSTMALLQKLRRYCARFLPDEDKKMRLNHAVIVAVYNQR